MFSILPGSNSYLESLSNLWLLPGNQKQSASSAAQFPRCWESRMLAEGKIEQHFIFQLVIKELLHYLTGSTSEFYSLISFPNALNSAIRFKSLCFFGTASHIKLHTFLGMHSICPITSRLRPILLSQILETNLLLDLVLVFQFVYTWHQNHKKFT